MIQGQQLKDIWLWLWLWFINTFSSNYTNLQCVYKFWYKKVYILHIYMLFIKITIIITLASIVTYFAL